MSRDDGLRKKKVVVVVSAVLAAVAIIAVLGAILWNASIFTGINGSVFNQKGLNGKKTGEEGQSGDAGAGSVKKGVENFLLCGLDDSEQLTDVIMLVSINFDSSQVNILQIPRDTYAESGTGSTGKINSAYAGGDKDLTPINRLIKVINQQFMIRVDHYATVTTESFRAIVDAVGGIPIDMPYQVGSEKYGIIPAGPQVLTGEWADWLVRHRGTYYDQDIGRAKVQRLFLAACVEKMQTIGLKEVTKILPAIYGNVTTDLSLADIKGYLPFALGMDLSKIRIHITPGEGLTYKGQSVWSLHKYETADLLNTYFREEGEEVEADELGIKELAHTGIYYENTEDDFQSLIDGSKPGQRKEAQESTVYTHTVTATATTPRTETTTTADSLETMPEYSYENNPFEEEMTEPTQTMPPIETSIAEVYESTVTTAAPKESVGEGTVVTRRESTRRGVVTPADR